MSKKKRPKQDQTKLLAAVRAVSRGKSLSATARLYGVPKTTLYDHSKGRLRGCITGPGRKLSLTMEEEQSLINYIKYMADRGRPLTNRMLKKFATAILRRKEHDTQIDKNKGPSDKWCQRFRKRHPEIKLRKPDKASNPRMEVTREDIEEYYDLLESTIDSLGLKDKPECIFNCDETGISGKEVIRGKVLVKSSQHPYQEIMNGGGGHLSINMAISAAGNCLPLMLIFAKHMPRNLDGLPGDWMLELSKKGYMNGDLFLTWFKDLFIPHCGRQRPVILIMDNLASHLSPDIIDVAKRNRIELLCLPPNSTHLLQPLDVAVFHKFKGEYSKLMNQLGYSFTSIPREKVPHVVKFALNAMCPQDYVTAFRRAGIRPVNRSIVLESGKQALRSRQEIENPGTLVDIGIIPEALIDIFPAIPEKSKTKRSTCKGARLITADKQTDQEKSLQPSTSNPREPEEPIPSSSSVQPLKRTRSSSRSKPAKKSKSNENSRTKSVKKVQNKDQYVEVHLDDGICEVCMLNDRLEWVGCDMCTRWYHYECLPHSVQTEVDFSIVTGSYWHCTRCDEE